MSDIFEDAPQDVLEELAEHLSLRFNGNAVQDFIGPRTREYMDSNIERIRDRLRLATGSVRLDAVDDWEIWATESVEYVQIRELTKIVLVPMPYRYGPEHVQEWLRTCAREHGKVKPSKEVYDWLWDMRLIRMTHPICGRHPHCDWLAMKCLKE